MLEWMKKIIKGDLLCKLDEISNTLNNDRELIGKLDSELRSIRADRDRYKNLVIAVGNTIPDLMWAKDTEGKYIYANPEIRRVLFYSMDKVAVLGRTDVELAKMCKRLVGDKNHTFGEICGNSDAVVLAKLDKDKFLEYGKVNGKDVYLEVHKAPFYNADGKLLGTVGTGRDVTEYYLGLKEAIDNCAESACVQKLRDELDKYKFEG
jgi:PAS domain-containing protein